MSVGSRYSFQPAMLGTLAVAFEADFGTTIATGVSQWNDLSGNGLNATQATGANQPTFSATGGPNGRAMLTFDGVNDSLSWPSYTPAFANGLSCYLVLSQTTGVGNAHILTTGQPQTNNNSLIKWYEDSTTPTTGTYQTYTTAAVGGVTLAGASSLPAGTAVLLTTIQSGTSGTLYKNGASVATSAGLTAITTVARSGNFIGSFAGGSNWWTGNLCAVYLFARNHTAAEQAACENWFRTKYALY